MPLKIKPFKKTDKAPKQEVVSSSPSVCMIEVTLTNGDVMYAEGEHAREMYMWWIACEGFAEREGVIPRVKGFNVRKKP